MKRKILWVDDEIDLLKAHIIFLEKKGYELVPVTNGQDAIALVKERTFDAVLLDEMMPGIDGLSVLAEIKNYDPGLPVVMITKSEEEHLMDDALGSRISDYLIKPVNPSQIYTTLKRLLDSRQLRSERVSREFARQLNLNRQELSMGLDYERWPQMYANISSWDIEISTYNDSGLNQIHADQKKEYNREFSKYIEKNYRSWIQDGGPVFSHNILDRYVAPLLKNNERVYFIVIDCFRLDHWLSIEAKLEEMFYIDRNYYYSILPTATPFCRNALFAGQLPVEIAKIYPEIWQSAGHDEAGMNIHEQELLEMYLARKGIRLDHKPHYEKIITNDDAVAFQKKLGGLRDNQFISVVYNFVDLLSHQRSESNILQEIAPDEAAFRSLTRSWFEHSVLLETLRTAASERATVVITTDHGNIMCEKATIVKGDKTTSTNVRYKYGRYLKCDPAEVFLVDDPKAYGLPSIGQGTTYLFAKNEDYLVYPNNFRLYQKLYQNSLQHGGISMEEMILPVGVLRPR
ncbi:bifunctional response regulator/alkaline phosphatase family protein [bacterium]|nr:bifunctional response regulator/alkaline phosphatase family protein [bacterium]